MRSVSNECALGSDVVPMVFGFCRYPSSVCDSETQLYVKQLEANAKCDPQCPSHKTSFADALAFAFVGFLRLVGFRKAS